MLTFTRSHTCRTIYTQMSSMFVTQGSVMQRDIPWGDSTVKVPSASMAVFNTVAIIVLVGHAERLLWGERIRVSSSLDPVGLFSSEFFSS